MKLKSLIGIPDLPMYSPEYARLIEDANDDKLRKGLINEMHSLRSFSDTWIGTDSPLRAYVEEIHKAYVGRAFGAAIIYCGVVAEQCLAERVAPGQPNKKSEEELLDDAVQMGFLDPGARKTVELLQAVRDYHAHPLEHIRPKTRERYKEAEERWGIILVEDFSTTGGNFLGRQFEPYSRDVALKVIEMTMAMLAVLAFSSGGKKF